MDLSPEIFLFTVEKILLTTAVYLMPMVIGYWLRLQIGSVTEWFI